MAFNVMRLPYHRAPFYFAPEFLATPDQWQVSFKKLIDDVLRCERKEASIVTDHAYGLAVVFGRAEFHIDALGGTFWIDDAEDRNYGLVHCAPPRTFLQYTLDAKRFSQSFWPIVEDTVAPFAERLAIEMEARFEEALLTLQAQIEAKLGARTAAFRQIDPQDRRHLRLIYSDFREQVASTDSDLDDALYDTGERVFSYGVVVLGNEDASDTFDDLPKAAATSSKRVGKQKQKRGPGAPQSIRWDTIDPIIEEVRRLHPSMTKADVHRAVMDRLAELGLNMPGKTSLDDRIRIFFRDKKSLTAQRFPAIR